MICKTELRPVVPMYKLVGYEYFTKAEWAAKYDCPADYYDNKEAIVYGILTDRCWDAIAMNLRQLLHAAQQI